MVHAIMTILKDLTHTFFCGISIIYTPNPIARLYVNTLKLKSPRQKSKGIKILKLHFYFVLLLLTSQTICFSCVLSSLSFVPQFVQITSNISMWLGYHPTIKCI